MDVIIKDVPEGAEMVVRQMAMVAIDRFLQQPVLDTPQTQSYKDNMDAVLVANGLPKRFDVAPLQELEEKK